MNTQQIKFLIVLASVIILPGLLKGQDTTSQKQNPCPAGMTMVKIINGNAIVTESATGVVTKKYYKAWPWRDCQTGKLYDQARKSHTEVDSSFYQFTYQTDTLVCLLVREKEKKVTYIESRCEIDTLDRTPRKPDSAYVQHSFYPDFAIRHSKVSAELGLGYRLTQFYTTQIDSTAPRTRDPLQITAGAEIALTLYAEALPLKVDCTTCGNLVEKQDAKIKPGFNSRVYATADFRGKKTLNKNATSNPRFEARGYAGLAYHCTETYNHSTMNRGLGGLEVIFGAGLISLNPKGPYQLFGGPEATLHFGFRPFAGFEGHTTLVIRGLFSGERFFKKKKTADKK